MYGLIRPLLFCLDAEQAHELSLDLLDSVAALYPGLIEQRPVEVMGLRFANPVGLAAGLDKNGDHLRGLSQLGFGFVELGTVTPRAQPGNPRPRLFRLPKAEAIINRMGFNNFGIEHLLQQLEQQRPSQTVVGINLGKNKDTPLAEAVHDYCIGLHKAWQKADYLTINISSPNTPGLRGLQTEEMLNGLLSGLQEQRKALQDQHGFDRPIALKVAPDLQPEEIDVIADSLRQYKLDALIATNTTLDRQAVAHLPHADEAGGLSGKVLQQRSFEVLCAFLEKLQGDLPVISVGGIDSAQEAQKRLDQGAALVQVYSALIYQGPAWVARLIRSLRD